MHHREVIVLCVTASKAAMTLHVTGLCRSGSQLCTFLLSKATGGFQGGKVDGLKDLLVQLGGLGAIKGHTQQNEGVRHALEPTETCHLGK